jgi:hypothetical protein
VYSRISWWFYLFALPWILEFGNIKYLNLAWTQFVRVVAAEPRYNGIIDTSVLGVVEYLGEFEALFEKALTLVLLSDVWSCLMKKTRGWKTRARVPLTYIKLTVQLVWQCCVIQHVETNMYCNSRHIWNPDLCRTLTSQPRFFFLLFGLLGNSTPKLF